MATPSTVTAVYNDALVSTFDIHKPEKLNVLFRKYGKQGLGFFNILNTLGYKKPVAQTRYSHFEEDWIHQASHVLNNVGAPGAGNPITFRLDPAQDLDAGNRFFIQVNDNVMFANQVTGTVTVISAVGAVVDVTVQPHSSTDNIGALTAGDTVISYSDSWAEGTTQPPGHVTRPIEYFFDAKIIKVTNEATGSEQTNRIWVETMSDGQKLVSWVTKGQIDADYEMALRMDGALLFDRPTTNATLTAAGQRTTFGLVPWIRSGGNVDTYVPGFYSIQDFYSQTEVLDASFAPNEMLSLLGISLYNEWEQLFANTFTQGALVYGSFNEGKKEIDLNIGFKSFTAGERGWHLKKMNSFSHPYLYGAAGFPLKGMGIMCPMDKVKDANPDGSNMIPSIGCRYKELGDYSRQMKVWLTGGAKANTNQVDKDELNMRTEMGSQYIASNRFFLVEQI
jgi:hypothetical protein